MFKCLLLLVVINVLFKIDVYYVNIDDIVN